MAIIAFGSLSDFVYHYRTLTSELLRKQEKCKVEYERNNCEPGVRLEAVEDFCEQQQKCLDRQISYIETLVTCISTIPNSFAEHLTLQSLFILGLLLVVVIIFYQNKTSGQKIVEQPKMVKHQ